MVKVEQDLETGLPQEVRRGDWSIPLALQGAGGAWLVKTVQDGGVGSSTERSCLLLP